MALQTGIHTEMKSQYLDEKYVQRCRLVWSTLYILERNMASLLGVPLLIAEEYISTPYPICPRNKQRTNTLEIQMKISKILSKIHLSMSISMLFEFPADILKVSMGLKASLTVDI